MSKVRQRSHKALVTWQKLSKKADRDNHFNSRGFRNKLCNAFGYPSYSGTKDRGRKIR